MSSEFRLGANWHSSDERFERDRARDNALQLMGWHVLRFTWRDVKDDTARVVASLREHLLQRRANPPRLITVAPRCFPAAAT